MTGQPKKPLGLSPEDRRLWDRIRKDVIPLPKRRTVDPLDQLPAPAAAKQDRSAAGEHHNGAKRQDTAFAPPVARPSAPYYPPVSAPAATPSSGSVSLDQKTLREIKKGRLSIDGRIDLHGMTQMRAHAALRSFLLDSAARGHRIVLVITGKGRQSAGILRQQVPHWLAESPFHDLVSGFRAAHLSHGGEGALYVRLRRRRER